MVQGRDEYREGDNAVPTGVVTSKEWEEVQYNTHRVVQGRK